MIAQMLSNIREGKLLPNIPVNLSQLSVNSTTFFQPHSRVYYPRYSVTHLAPDLFLIFQWIHRNYL